MCVCVCLSATSSSRATVRTWNWGWVAMDAGGPPSTKTTVSRYGGWEVGHEKIVSFSTLPTGSATLSRMSISLTDVVGEAGEGANFVMGLGPGASSDTQSLENLPGARCCVIRPTDQQGDLALRLCPPLVPVPAHTSFCMRTPSPSLFARPFWVCMCARTGKVVDACARER
jgi:hypothetical protein